MSNRVKTSVVDLTYLYDHIWTNSALDGSHACIVEYSTSVFMWFCVHPKLLWYKNFTLEFDNRCFKYATEFGRSFATLCTCRIESSQYTCREGLVMLLGSKKHAALTTRIKVKVTNQNAITPYFCKLQPIRLRDSRQWYYRIIPQSCMELTVQELV